MDSKYPIIFQNMNCFPQIKIIRVLIHYYYNFPYLELSCLPYHLCQFLPQPTETLLQHNLHRVLPRFPYFVLPNSTTCHYKYWIYQSICQVKPMKFIVKLYSDQNTLQLKQASHQKAESSRGTSLSKLANTVSNNSIFNSKYA